MLHIFSTKNFNKKEVDMILERASILEGEYKNNTLKPLLKDKIIVSIFFEPSTRTRLSFETAAIRLGANIISSENASNSSSSYKGETIEDTTRMLCCYGDAIVIRHPVAGSVKRAVEVSTKPILNAGDGANEHPSQAFLDLYSIKKEHKRLENLTITFVGDLLNSRTIHSLLPFLTMYDNNKFYFVSPKSLSIPREFIKSLEDKNIFFKEIENLEDVLKDTDVLYMTRVQKERFENTEEYERLKDAFVFTKDSLMKMKRESVIMHPLPRINEIDPSVDDDPRAGYFRQAENGLYVRMALFLYVFGL